MPKTPAAHEFWAAHAANYRQLAKATNNPEVHRIVCLLARVCSDMAKATNPDPALKADLLGLHQHEVAPEATAQRWRIREVKYRALAAESEPHDLAWLAIADQCAELANYLQWSAAQKINAAAEKRERAPALRASLNPF